MIDLLREHDAAAYVGMPLPQLRWHRRCGRVAYLPGRPPIYERSDLDEFVEDELYRKRQRDAPFAIGPPKSTDVEKEAMSVAARTWLQLFVRKQESQALSFVLLDLREVTGVWHLRYRIGSRHRQVSTRQRTRWAAEHFLHIWRVRLRDAQAEQNRKSTCAEVWAFYMRERVQRKCHAPERHVFAWAKLAPRFGSLRPNEVTYELVQEHLAERLPTKPTTVFVELSYLLASWHFAARRRILQEEDFPTREMLGVPGPPPPRQRWLLGEELEAVFKAARSMRKGDRLSRLERFIWIAICTGARRGAILELTWSQVDFETRVIHFNPEGRQQTKKRRASVPISDDLSSLLFRAWRERKNDLVLDHSRRMPDALAAAGKRSGVAGLTHNVFRHTFATDCARRDVPLWKISKILGNTVGHVEKSYAHHSLADLRGAVEAISSRTDIVQETLGPEKFENLKI